VSTQRDAQHCGQCGVACGAGQSCLNGACVAGCPAPLTSCTSGPDACVDARNDPLHCGACNQPCPPRPQSLPACVAGACVIAACQPGFEDCNGVSMDGCEAPLFADPMNCGFCGNRCPLGQGCMNGLCGCPLPPGPYLSTCMNCDSCSGTLTCQCLNSMGMPMPASISLTPPCPLYFNCNGSLQCTAC
jgi:hypothetical protein